jgi:hypothetical protein
MMAITIMISTSVKPLFFIFVPPWILLAAFILRPASAGSSPFFHLTCLQRSSITPFRIPLFLIFVLPECGLL